MNSEADEQPRPGKKLTVTGRAQSLSAESSSAEASGGDRQRAGLNVLPGLAEVPVKLRVIIGSSEISLHDAANLTQKSLLPLGSTVNDPVDIVVNGQLIAREKLVVVDDSYGVQITELVG